jgi:hypothetical protein
MTVLEQHNILRGKRHRFRVRISTLTQLVPTTEEIAKHLETEKLSDMDFKPLYAKLHRYS